MDKKKAYLSSIDFSKNYSKFYDSNNNELTSKQKVFNSTIGTFLNTSTNNVDNEKKNQRDGKDNLNKREYEKDFNLLNNFKYKPQGPQNKFQFNKKFESKRIKTASILTCTDQSIIFENDENKKNILNTSNNLPERHSSSQNTSQHSENKYGETKRKLDYNIKLNSRNNDRKSVKVDSGNNIKDLISNEEGMEIVKFLSPKLNKLKSKEQRLSNLYIKGK